MADRYNFEMANRANKVARKWETPGIGEIFSRAHSDAKSFSGASIHKVGGIESMWARSVEPEFKAWSSRRRLFPKPNEAAVA